MSLINVRYPKQAYIIPALMFLVAFTDFFLIQCSGVPSTPAKALNGAAVQVADDKCRELEAEGGAPEWVELLCVIPDVENQVVKVLLPRLEWSTIRARGNRKDAGPGK